MKVPGRQVPVLPARERVGRSNEQQPDPDNWRTWRREGDRLFPPPGTTGEQSIVGMHAFSLAVWGVDPARPRRDHRNVIGVLEKIDGKYVQLSFGRVMNGKRIDIRVRGGCRT
jgi:hypothetical protein